MSKAKTHLHGCCQACGHPFEGMRDIREHEDQCPKLEPKPRTMEQLEARVAELELAFKEQQNCVCAYCGHKTIRDLKSDEEFSDDIREHIAMCDKRPEKQMLTVIAGISEALGVELDKIEDKSTEALLQTLATRWELIQEASDRTIAENTKLREALDQVDDMLGAAHIVAKDNDYCKALADLIAWEITIHDDPAVSEVAKKRADRESALVIGLVPFAAYGVRLSQDAGAKDLPNTAYVAYNPEISPYDKKLPTVGDCRHAAKLLEESK